MANAVAGLIDTVPERPAGPVPKWDSLSPAAPFRIVNIGNSEPVEHMDFITAAETATGREIEKRMLSVQSATSRRPGPRRGCWSG